MTTPSTIAGPAPSPSLATAFGGIWRLTYPRVFTAGHLLAFAGLLGLLGVIAYAIVDQNDGPKEFMQWIGRFYMTFLVPVLAFLTAAGALRDDMRPGTVDYVLTRPVPRPAYTVFKYLAHIAVVQVEFLLALAVLTVIATTKSTPAIIPALPSLVAAQVMLVFAFTAFGFLCAVLTSRYVVIGLLYGAVVEIGVGQIPTQLNRLSMAAQVNTFLKPIYDAAVSMPAGMSAQPAGAYASMAGPLFLFSAVTLALAVLVFSLRELATANES